MADPVRDRIVVGRWLALWAATVFVLVLVGGGTRLTESGLSITEWKPVSGVIPPLSAEAWAIEFEKYKQIPQYAQMNADMTLDGFKAIYWWEFVHRLVARLAGLVFALPFFWFLWRRRIPREVMPRVVTIGVLTIAQAALGWYMVASGLTERVNVSQYRLAAHLSLAIVIYLLTLWTADALLNPASALASTPTDPGRIARARRWVVAAFALASVTVVSGAFVAGLRAGKIYNEFPMMGAGLVPIDYATLTPWWRNALEHPSAAQFHHRVLAMVTLVVVLGVWIAYRKAGDRGFGLRLDLAAAAVAVQVALGITTLLLAVPVTVAIAHQAGALLLLTALALALRQLRAT